VASIRLLLVYDVEGWACHTECKAIRLHLERCAPGRFSIAMLRAGSAYDKRLFDIVFSTIYYHLPDAAHPRSVSQVSSYSYWIRKEADGGAWPQLKQWKYMIAKNTHIASILTPDDHPRITKLYHALDYRHWQPRRPTHRDPSVFTIGFAGHQQDLKGLKLIKQAIAGLDGVRLLAPTWESNRIPQDQMPGLYSSLDAYVCMSRPGHDAGPRPPMEAALCGVPIITTRAGQIGEMIEDGVNGLVIERTVEAAADAVSKLKSDVQLRKRLAQNVRRSLMDEWVFSVGQQWTDYMLNVMSIQQ